MEIPDGFAQANFIYGGTDQPSGAEWTMGFDVSGFSGSPTDLAEICVIAYNSNNLDQFHTSQTILQLVKVKFGPTATGPSGEFGTTSPGTAAGSACPPQVAALIRKLTAFGGRAGRGRIYFPGVPEGQVSSGGILSDAWINNLPVEMATTMTQIELAPVNAVLLHGAGSPISTPTPITGFSVPARCVTQRRRNRPS